MLRLSALCLAAALGGAAAKAPCDLGVVGAGAGGAYAAWRASADGRRVCVFEMANRPGGRIHSLRGMGPRGDLVVEAGGYRFAPKPVNMPEGKIVKTPLTAAIIQELGLRTAIYNPNASEWDHGMHKIVDEHGEDRGYLTFIERMLDVAKENGAQVRYNAEVTAIGQHGSILSIKLRSGEDIPVKAVLLNLPQRPVVELLRHSAGLIAARFPRPLYIPLSYPIMKLYVHYDDAWWRNELNLVSGPFFNAQPWKAQSSRAPGAPADVPPLQGQYHDGHVRCDLPGNRCRGYLQAFYGGDEPWGAVYFYAPFVDAISGDSAVSLDWEVTHHRELLEEVHAALLAFHKPALDAKNATARVAEMRPTGGVASVWSQGVAGIHAGCHIPKRKSDGSTRSLSDLAKAALQPLDGLPIFVANEAFGTVGCFAEGSLAMAEAAVQRMNVSLPASGWLQQGLAESLLESDDSLSRPETDPFLLQAKQAALRSDTAPALPEQIRV